VDGRAPWPAWERREEVSPEWRRIPAGLSDPATEEVLGSVAVAAALDVDAAVLGRKRWRQPDAWTRSNLLRCVAVILRQWTPRLADVLPAEQGKPLSEARAEVTAAADQFDWYADEARRIYGRTISGHTTENRLLVVKEPVGPVAAFSAWNLPPC
jgi:succinate-semialdehyde dehydrogenase/glutarate-semialdehyde dehydrogenase